MDHFGSYLTKSKNGFPIAFSNFAQKGPQSFDFYITYFISNYSYPYIKVKDLAKGTLMSKVGKSTYRSNIDKEYQQTEGWQRALCYNYFANLLCFKLKYLFFCMIGMIFYMIWVCEECQHGDAIPVSQQFGVCPNHHKNHSCTTTNP